MNTLPLTADVPMSLRYLIGGNPKGGTHFVARYLTRCGFPTTHECLDWRDGRMIRCFNQFTHAPDPIAECSYTVSEWCHRPGVDHLPIIMLIRNPIQILVSLWRSAYTKGAINPNALMTQILEQWKRLEETGRVVFRCRIEHDMQKLCEFLGLDPLSEENMTECREANPEMTAFRAVAARYGYL